MLEDNSISKSLVDSMGKVPDKAERFYLADDFFVDFLQFDERPFPGVSSIITNGVSHKYPNLNLEFVITFDRSSISSNVDLNAFLATYLQFNVIDNDKKICIGDFFRVPGKLVRGYDFVGVYTTHPCYFPGDVFMGGSKVKFLWLIPIFENEYNFISEAGADEFESFLQENDPDMSKFDREPIWQLE